MKVTPVRKFNGRMPGTVMEFPEATARSLIKAGLMQEIAEVTEKPKRRYARRDMQAEGTP